MNIVSRQEAHNVALLKQKLEQHKQFRSAEQELEDCEARINSLIRTDSNGQNVKEAGSFTELDSSHLGSIGDSEEVGINKDYVTRQTNALPISGRP